MRRLALGLVLGLALLLAAGPSAPAAPTASRAMTGTQCMTIYAVYRDGGIAGTAPTYNQQYISLLNRCSTAVNMSTVLYDWYGNSPLTFPGGGQAACSGSCMLAGGHFWLVAFTPSAGAGAALPTPDQAQANFLLPLSGGIVVYLLGTHSGGACPASALDEVGFDWSSSPCAEGTQAGTPSATGSQDVHRNPSCIDLDNNSIDFTVGTPQPRNSQWVVSPVPCTAGINTVASLASSSATRTAKGVLVRWRTGTESAVLGFDVYRSVGSRFVKLNRGLVRGSFASTTRGLGHSFLDPTAPAGNAKYRIRVVWLDGTSSLLGDVVAPAKQVKTYRLTATLTAGAEVPPQEVKRPRARGTFSGTYNPSTKKLSWTLHFQGLTGPATAAHVHAAKPGVAGPVRVPLCGPCTDGQRAAVFIGGGAAAGAVVGQKPAYVNVHTAANPAGEIRGQVKVTPIAGK